jgi:hypothetical protein
MRVALAALGLALACSGSRGPHDYQFENQGRICVWAGQGLGPSPPGDERFPANFVAGETAQIMIVMPHCLSGTCSKEPKAECQASLGEAGVVQVRSMGSYHDIGGACSEDCSFLVAKCTTPALRAGEWIVRHGDQEIALEVPSAVDAPCAGKAP